MGCDIHAMIESRADHEYEFLRWWTNRGDPEIVRYYGVFTALANVRSGVTPRPFIAEPRGVPDDACEAFSAWHAACGADAHSASWVTLAEVKAYDASWMAGCSNWQHLIDAMEKVRRPAQPEEDVRLVFFFDN